MMRGSAPGLLLVFADGRLLTWQRFVDPVREALRKAGVDHSKCCGHSFWIGAATTAAEKGVEDCIIKTLGQWESLASNILSFRVSSLAATLCCWHRDILWYLAYQTIVWYWRFLGVCMLLDMSILVFT